MKNIIEKIYDYTLEDIMEERFARYSKYIIQDRAIPDVRDGLKPVQRRILFSMYKEKNTYDRGYRKSAKTVGDVIGNYHPHGDSSIYEAMVRMSQDWKMKNPYIDMHGNNGSIDGDSPAAYRYTEARLSKISNELLRDIDKNTVIMTPNFDDTVLEPTVLPARFPNLLVNGTNGISAGYATNIPPHNLGEIINATILLIEKPDATLEEVMSHVIGPDFPTGGIIEAGNGIKEAYQTGRGKIIVKSRTSFVEDKKNLSLIISEIPFEVNKALLVRKIDEIRIDKKIDGIVEVRDESDRDGLRIAIDLKKDANKDLILKYLLKNTDLQVSFNFNMIAIVNKRPKQLGIIEILKAYIAHQKEVLINRTEFDLKQARDRFHIVEGLIKCIDILDEVVYTIRHSKNKSDAKLNIIEKYGFSERQAEAIVTLQLYKLTNTDVTLLQQEMSNLEKIIKGLEAILNNENVRKKVMIDELTKIKEEYDVPRKTDVQDEITEIKIDTTSMIPKEDVIVLITKDGYVKRTSFRSYQSSSDEPTIKEKDYVLGLFELNTMDTILLFTNLGNYLYVPVHEIPDLKWKDLGKHISNIIKIGEEEEIVSVIPVTNFAERKNILMVTKNGMIKKTELKDFKLSRYSKPISCMKLKEDDRMLSAFLEQDAEIFLASKRGYGLWFESSEIPLVGLRTSGVKAMNLKEDEIVAMSNFDATKITHITVVTDKATAKRVALKEFEKTSRARRGLLLFREVKTNPYHVVKTFAVSNKHVIGLKGTDISFYKLTEIPILDRYSIGSNLTKDTIINAFVAAELMKKENLDDEVEESIEPPKEVSLKEIDDRLMTIDDFLDGV